MRIETLIRRASIFLILAFTLVPGGMHIKHAVLGHSGGGLQENRVMKDWPKWNDVDGKVTGYTSGISDHINDHFGGRTSAIKMRNWIFQRVGDTSTSVIKGRTEGWYFLSDPTLWGSFQGNLAFTERDTEAWMTSLAAIKTASEQAGAVFAAMIPPDKARIYPEHAPIKYGDADSNRFVDALLADERVQALNLIDIDAPLISAKSRGTVFFKTDTHWNRRGALEGYMAAMGAFNLAGGNFTVMKGLPLKETQWDDVSGDLAGLLGLRGQITETVVDVIIPPLKTPFENELVEAESVRSPTWQTRIYSNGNTDGPTLVIIGDSFSGSLIPYFEHSFDTIVFMHHQMGGFDMETALSYNPDAVLFAPVERTAVTMRDFGNP